MAAYIIVDVDVTDRALFAEYAKAVPSTIAQYGGEYLVRGGKTEVLEGDWLPKRTVVLKFDSVEQAKQWHDSREYEQPKLQRQQSARTNMILVEGL